MAVWLYHKTEGSKLFKTEESALAALKKGWVDTPAKFEEVDETEEIDETPTDEEDVQPKYSTMSDEELKENYTVPELKEILKELGGRSGRRDTEDTIIGRIRTKLSGE